MKKKFVNAFLCLVLLGATSASFSSCSKDDPEPQIEKPEPKPDGEGDKDDEGEPEDENAVVEIPDAALKDAIKEALELSSEEVTEADLLKLDELDVEGNADIVDLTGLEKASNLTKINLGETSVTDLKPIAGLKKVNYLRVNDTKVADLSPVKDYTTLTYFNANTATEITDISPLAGNKDLQELILREVPMGNAGLDVIANFKKLYRLNIRETGITDITVLGDLMKAGALLKTTAGAEEAGKDAEIDLKDNDIESFDPIASFVEDGTAVSVAGYPKK